MLLSSRAVPRPRAGNGTSIGFERTFERNLVVEQRKAVLNALASRIDPDATLGEVLDAAEALGWSDNMGDLSLADLAEALLDEGEGAQGDETDEGEPDAEGDLEQDEDEEEIEHVARPSATKKTSKKKAAAKKKTSKKKAAKKKATAKKTPKKKASKKKAAAKKTSKKKASKKKTATKKKAGRGSTTKRGASARLRALRKKIDADEPMSLDEAAEVFVPVVEQLGNATMQDLEEATGVARRKLRFHIGQLVRHDYLERHGMGRGTYYTTA